MGTANEPGCDLAAEVASTFGRVCLRVSGTSMAPAIRPGDLLFVERASMMEVLTGEIVVFAQEGRLIAHRVAAKNGTKEEPYLVTRGDRKWRNDALVSGSELIGRVTQIVREHSNIFAPSRLNFIQQVVCRLFRFSDRATNLYLRFAALSREVSEQEGAR